MGKAILLTGRPGCGKTTVIRKVVAALATPAGGFYTRELRQEGRRVGFEIVTLDGRRGTLSHVEIPGRSRVGRYGVDLATLDELSVGAVRGTLATGGLVVIDEIGPMELLSARFREVVLEVLDSPATLLGTVMRRRTTFTDQIKNHPKVTLIEVTPGNRDTLPAQILVMLGQPSR